jgi:hypothetical protein
VRARAWLVWALTLKWPEAVRRRLSDDSMGLPLSGGAIQCMKPCREG